MNKKDEFIKIHEKTWRNTMIRSKIYLTLMVIFLIVLIGIFVEGYSLEGVINGESKYREIAEVQNSEECNSDVGVISSAFHMFLGIKGGFFTKFFIFLGVLYLLQVMFSLAFDFLEIILLIVVFFIKIFKWFVGLFRTKEKQEEKG
jgi:hypothetical protein